ncbi:hypothetical protein E3U43_007712 [Larimichthys crocea]|uniref:Uncharacterized protein n=1 Tax=Larimichthys crocea TaxID=215358 RepID=A0ACD3Q4Y2_LARCR|nr:hypothetical protein E3U43_007712 [Larimichthys crocea]
MIRDATAADSRARARNGSGREIAAPLSLLLFTSARGSPLTLSLCDDMAYIFEGKTSDSPLVAYRGQPLLLPLGHNNNRCAGEVRRSPIMDPSD